MPTSTCRYVFLISNYLTSILQYMNITFASSYTNNLITTKCLNTAVMLVILLVGSDKIKSIQQCDVPNTIQRHVSHEENNKTIMRRLHASLCSINSKKPCMYYIMLTDGRLSNVNRAKGTSYFPGHVFIVEKTVKHEFYVYQSFIAKYDLNDFIVKNKCKKHSLSEVKDMCAFFKRFLKAGNVWDEEAVVYWKKLTSVDTSDFKDHETSNIFLCFKRFEIERIKQNISRFVSDATDTIQGHIENNNLSQYISNAHQSNQLSAVPHSIFHLKDNFDKMKRELYSKQ